MRQYFSNKNDENYENYNKACDLLVLSAEIMFISKKLSDSDVSDVRAYRFIH